jgi:hypothetical protein
VKILEEVFKQFQVALAQSRLLQNNQSNAKIDEFLNLIRSSNFLLQQLYLHMSGT